MVRAPRTPAFIGAEQKQPNSILPIETVEHEIRNNTLENRLYQMNSQPAPPPTPMDLLGS